jgi:spermidine/putrescine transport system permease protein
MSWVRKNIIMIVAILVLLYMFTPVFMVILLSFNEPKSRLTYTFDKFTLNNWLHPCSGAGDMCSAVSTSIQIGLLATLGATILGTLIAYALMRYKFRGRSLTNLLIFLPMASPEVVMGSSLLTLFVSLGFPLGFWTILIAHIMFCMSFVVVTVKARLASMDPRLEQAAMDLYATEWQTFRKVTLPLLLPGIASAALLSFSLSFDDFIVTNFNSGSTITFPMFVWGVSQRGIPPQVNVVGAAVFLIALFFVIVGQLASARKAKALQAKG